MIVKTIHVIIIIVYFSLILYVYRFRYSSLYFLRFYFILLHSVIFFNGTYLFLVKQKFFHFRLVPCIICRASKGQIVSTFQECTLYTLYFYQYQIKVKKNSFYPSSLLQIVMDGCQFVLYRKYRYCFFLLLSQLY